MKIQILFSLSLILISAIFLTSYTAEDKIAAADRELRNVLTELGIDPLSRQIIQDYRTLMPCIPTRSNTSDSPKTAFWLDVTPQGLLKITEFISQPDAYDRNTFGLELVAGWQSPYKAGTLRQLRNLYGEGPFYYSPNPAPLYVTTDLSKQAEIPSVNTLRATAKILLYGNPRWVSTNSGTYAKGVENSWIFYPPSISLYSLGSAFNKTSKFCFVLAGHRTCHFLHPDTQKLVNWCSLAFEQSPFPKMLQNASYEEVPQLLF